MTTILAATNGNVTAIAADGYTTDGQTVIDERAVKIAVGERLVVGLSGYAFNGAGDLGGRLASEAEDPDELRNALRNGLDEAGMQDHADGLKEYRMGAAVVEIASGRLHFLDSNLALIPAGVFNGVGLAACGSGRDLAQAAAISALGLGKTDPVRVAEHGVRLAMRLDVFSGGGLYLVVVEDGKVVRQGWGADSSRLWRTS